MPSRSKKIIENSKVKVEGNFQQGDNINVNILSSNRLEGFLSISDVEHYSRLDKNQEIIREFNRMNEEDLAKKFIYYVLSHIRKEKRKDASKLIIYEDGLQYWLGRIFLDNDANLSLTNLQEAPNYIFHEKRALIDVEEFLYYLENEEINRFRFFLIEVNLIKL